jgi:hypothetical protein
MIFVAIENNNISRRLKTNVTIIVLKLFSNIDSIRNTNPIRLKISKKLQNNLNSRKYFKLL